MTKYGKIILLLYICIAIAVVCVIVLNLVGEDECANIPVPSFSSALKSINNYKYPNKQTRIAMASIAEYIVSSNETLKDLKVPSMTDYAIHAIVSTPIKNIDLKRIRVHNDPKHVQAISGYDLMNNRFKSVGDKNLAISVSKKYYDDPAKAQVTDLYATIADSEIFEMLTRSADSSVSATLPIPPTDTTLPVPPTDTTTTTSSPAPPVLPPTPLGGRPAANTSGVISSSTLEDGTVLTFYKDGSNRMVPKDNSLIITDGNGQITVYAPT